MTRLKSREVGSHDADVSGFWEISSVPGNPSIAIVVSAVTNALSATIVLPGNDTMAKDTQPAEGYVTQSASAAETAGSTNINLSYTQATAGTAGLPDTCTVDLDGGSVQVGPVQPQNTVWDAYAEPQPPPPAGITLPPQTFGPIEARSQDGSQSTLAWVQLTVDSATQRLASITFFRSDGQTYPMVLSTGVYPMATVAQVPSGSLSTATDGA
ncbi:MAG: hypothetical protein AB8H79_22980 [Myxococcota bacterium]